MSPNGQKFLLNASPSQVECGAFYFILFRQRQRSAVEMLARYNGHNNGHKLAKIELSLSGVRECISYLTGASKPQMNKLELHLTI